MFKEKKTQKSSIRRIYSHFKVGIFLLSRSSNNIRGRNTDMQMCREKPNCVLPGQARARTKTQVCFIQSCLNTRSRWLAVAVRPVQVLKEKPASQKCLYNHSFHLPQSSLQDFQTEVWPCIRLLLKLACNGLGKNNLPWTGFGNILSFPSETCEC